MQSYTLKFILIGDSGVGKSQLSRCFTKKQFKNDIQSTVGIEFSTREIVFDKSLIKAQIWDTAGMERFDSMSKAYYRDAVGALLVYDVTNPKSFERIQNFWLNQLQEYGHEKMSVVLVGNKLDRTYATRQLSLHDMDESPTDEGVMKKNRKSSSEENARVPTEDAIAFAESHGFDFTEVSAYSSENVDTAFRRLVISVAKLLPEVSIHLELLGLPDGWLHSQLHLSSTSSDSEDSAPKTQGNSSLLRNSFKKETSALDIQQSQVGLQTNKPKSQRIDIDTSYANIFTPTPTASEKKSIPIKIPKLEDPNNINNNDNNNSNSNKGNNNVLAVKSPFQTPDYFDGDLQITDSPRYSNGSGGSSPDRATTRVVYTNYWTGEATFVIPTAPAPAGLLYATDKSKLVEEVTLKDFQSSSMDLIRESISSSVIALETIQSKSNRNSSNLENNISKGNNQSIPGKKEQERLEDIPSPGGSASGSPANNNKGPGKNRNPNSGGKSGNGGGISMRSNKVVDDDVRKTEGSQHRCFCLIL